MKRSFLLNSIAFFFIILFLYTGGAKLMEINSFREQISSSPLLGSIAGTVAVVLPIGEILLAIVLFVPVWRLKGLYLSGALMVLFTIYVIVILLIDNHLSCSCGGIVEELSPKQHLIFNGACIILSLVGIIVAKRKQPSISFKWMTATGTLCLFLVVGLTLFSAFTAPPTVKTGLEGRLLPSFDILLADSVTKINTTDLPTGKQLIFIGFSPVCKHCMQLTEDIISNIDSFKNVHLFFVTNFPFQDMKVYYRHFKLSKYPNISMGLDVKDYFFPYFKSPGVPYVAIYDSKKRLKQAVTGRFRADDLAKAVIEE